MVKELDAHYYSPELFSKRGPQKRLSAPEPKAKRKVETKVRKVAN